MCADVSIEPHFVQVTEDETTSTNREDAARLDIAARDFWRPSQRAFFDIRAFNAYAQSNISRNIEETFSHHEKETARQYSDRIVNIEHGSFTPLIFSTHGDYSQLTTRFIYQLAKLISQKRNICFSESKSWLNSKLNNFVARLTILCIRGWRKIRPPNTENISRAVSKAQICWWNTYKPELWMETTLLFISFFNLFYFLVAFMHAAVLIYTKVNLTSFKKIYGVRFLEDFSCYRKLCKHPRVKLIYTLHDNRRKKISKNLRFPHSQYVLQ